MDPINATLLAILFTIFAYLIYQAWKVNQYWKERGIPHQKPLLFLGNAAPILLLRKDVGQCQEDICRQFPNDPFIGYYDFMQPVLLVKDPEVIERITIKDFVHFVDHGFSVDEERRPLDSNLFTMGGKRWKAVRNKLSPIFTTGKLKLMFDSMAECGDGLVKILDESDEFEMREILGRFAMDVIGSCAFGIEAGNLAQPDSEFRRMGKKSFEMDFKQFIKFIIITNFPSIFKKFNITFNRRDVLEYFSGIIRNTVEYRRENNIKRNDFLQLMMQLQDKGCVEVHTKDPDDDYLNIESNTYSTEKFELTNDQLTGQAFTFLTAGFEGTTLAMMYTLYELSKNPTIQEKAREEIQREIEKGGSLTYDTVREMTYLEQCVKETMRKYPPTQLLFRVCTKTYTLPNGLKIEPGQKLVIAVKTVHYDPLYYPNPELYKPERFDPDNNIPNGAYLPFGNGPRICIAMRFAMMQIKYCLAKLLVRYNFTVSPKTKEPLTVSVRNFFTSPNEKVIFNVKKIIA